MERLHTWTWSQVTSLCSSICWTTRFIVHVDNVEDRRRKTTSRNSKIDWTLWFFFFFRLQWYVSDKKSSYKRCNYNILNLTIKGYFLRMNERRKCPLIVWLSLFFSRRDFSTTDPWTAPDSTHRPMMTQCQITFVPPLQSCTYGRL